jgi:hypothetical protein
MLFDDAMQSVSSLKQLAGDFSFNISNLMMN